MTTQLSDFKGQGESSCCGAGTYGEYLMCENCDEPCEDVSEERLTPKEQLTKDRRHILKDMTVEKAEKYPELYSNLFGQADTMYRFNLLNSNVISND